MRELTTKLWRPQTVIPAKSGIQCVQLPVPSFPAKGYGFPPRIKYGVTFFCGNDGLFSHLLTHQ